MSDVHRYWMPLDFFRKVILTGLLIFWARGSLNQLAAGVLVAAFFLVLGIVNRPFGKNMNNNLYNVCNACILATFSSGLVLSDRIDKTMEPKFFQFGAGIVGHADEEFGDLPTIETLLILVNILVPIGWIAYEFGRIRLMRESEVDPSIAGIHWPFASWEESDGDGSKRIFIGCPPGETARLALLRREIEKLASTKEGKAECFEKAPAAGVPPQRLMMAEAGKLTNIVDVIMEAAALEGTGWGPFQKPMGLARRTLVHSAAAKDAKVEQEIAAQLAELEVLQAESRGEYRSLKYSSGLLFQAAVSTVYDG